MADPKEVWVLILEGASHATTIDPIHFTARPEQYTRYVLPEPGSAIAAAARLEGERAGYERASRVVDAAAEVLLDWHSDHSRTRLDVALTALQGAFDELRSKLTADTGGG